jgi:predicted XRE-type DNA-binding protein
MSNDKKVTVGSGNVFADLGFGNPEEELLKANLIREIRAIIKRRKLTQAKAAAMLGLKQPDVSSIITGRVGKFSIDRLVGSTTTYALSWWRIQQAEEITEVTTDNKPSETPGVPACILQE